MNVFFVVGYWVYVIHTQNVCSCFRKSELSRAEKEDIIEYFIYTQISYIINLS